MKAMLWKELRENMKWALLAMVGLGLAEVYGLYYIDSMNPNNRGITLCNPTFLMATSFGNALVGLILGLVQILPEQRRDQWAALLHRPVSRAVIFRGKALAGLLLYLLAAVPPFLLCFWLAATPGHFVAPFVPELILPGVSDICTGVVFYFAALIVALQRGSWFGARTFALLAAVYLLCSMSTMHYFYLSVEASVIFGLILFTAAWGAMLSNGKFHDRPWLGRLALLAAVFYGVCGIGLLASTMITASRGFSYFTGSEYKVTQDGQPIIVSNQNMTTTVTDLAGHVIHDDRFTGNRSYANEIDLYEMTYRLGDSHGYEPDNSYFNYRLSYEYIQEIDNYGEYQNPIQWFFLHSAHYAVGIDRRTKAESEIADRSGFKPAGFPVEPFSGTLSHWYDTPCLVQEGTDAFIYNLAREERTPLTSNNPTPVYGFALRTYDLPGGKGSDQVIAVARGQGVQLFDSNGVFMTTLPYDPQVNLDRWGTLQFGPNALGDRYYLLYTASAWVPQEEKWGMPEYLDEIDAKGILLHSYTLPPLPGAPYQRTWLDYLGENLHAPAIWFWNLGYQKMGAALGIKHLVEGADFSFHTHWPRVKQISEEIAAWSLFFAAIALGWARWKGMAWRRAWAWAGFVFSFNLAGLITFWIVADFPVRVSCPQCGRKRPIEERECPHCQAGWTLPVARGTEIFDDKAPAVAAGEVSHR
jgi:hypothetical protein